MANERHNPTGDPRKSRIVLLLFFLFLLPAVAKSECDLYFYYDLGTKQCEFCCDVCCDANVKGTSLQCEEDCPKYAQKQREEAAQQLLDDGQSLGNDGRTGQSSGSGQSGFPLAAQIGIPLASCVVVALLLLLILGLGFASRRRRKALARKNASKGVQPASPHEAVRPTETIPLRAQPSFSQDFALRIDDEAHQELLGVRESGDESGESLEERSREGETIAPAAEAFGESSGETGFFEGVPDLSDLSTVLYMPQQSDGRPHQESMEGHWGNMEFVPNEGNPLKSDDTKRKTFAPSDPLGMGTTIV